MLVGRVLGCRLSVIVTVAEVTLLRLGCFGRRSCQFPIIMSTIFKLYILVLFNINAMSADKWAPAFLDCLNHGMKAAPAVEKLVIPYQFLHSSVRKDLNLRQPLW